MHKISGWCHPASSQKIGLVNYSRLQHNGTDQTPQGTNDIGTQSCIWLQHVADHHGDLIVQPWVLDIESQYVQNVVLCCLRRRRTCCIQSTRVITHVHAKTFSCTWTQFVIVTYNTTICGAWLLQATLLSRLIRGH